MTEQRKRDVHAIRRAIGTREFPSRERRVQVSLRAKVQVAPTRSAEATIVDLSANGFRLVSDELLEVGQFVRVLSCSDALRGEIRWVAGREAGGTFAKPAQPISE